MAVRPSTALSRKALAIKRINNEPLTRADLQYDVLANIFSDTRAVFTDPYPTLGGRPAGSKVTFRDLYINAILHSPKASKILKDKIYDSPDFANDFAMLALLANVGRINTTMSCGSHCFTIPWLDFDSFYPAVFTDMKTAIRTYHPVPALQRTNGNLLDAPRIKNILKTALLENEAAAPPSTPSDISAKAVSLAIVCFLLVNMSIDPMSQRLGFIPSTNVVNLVFVMANHATVSDSLKLGSLVYNSSSSQSATNISQTISTS